MTSNTLNKHDIKIIRPALQRPLFDVVDYMAERGWNINLTLPSQESRGFVSFVKREPWHDRPTLASRCSWGYALEGSDEVTIDRTAQRSAELCLQIYAAFPDDIPSNPNIHGVISADPIANQARYKAITYDAFVERHQDKALMRVPTYRDETLCITAHNQHLYLSHEDIEVFRSDIEALRAALDGRTAFSC
jgi:hypothetical protein